MKKAPEGQRLPGLSRSARGKTGRRVESPEDERFLRVFGALGEGTRLKIMQILPREAVCGAMMNVVELAEALGLTQPTVSHHLKILSEAGLIGCRRQCNSLYFYVDQGVVVRWLMEAKVRFGCGE